MINEKEKHIESLRLEGNKNFSEKKFEEAYENFSKAIDIMKEIDYEIDKANVSIIFSNRCLALINLNKFEEALEDSEKSIEYNPNWFKGYLRKSQCLSKLNRDEEANEFMKISDEKNKENSFNGKKNLFNAIKRDEKIFTEEELKEKEINKQVDYLLKQYIKPNEEDAFRNLNEFHKLGTDLFDKNEAKKWINFGLKFGCGDSEDLMKILEDYISAGSVNLQKFHIKELKKYSGLDLIQ